MTKRVVQTFDAAFKENAVKLALDGKNSIASVAKDLGVGPSTLHGWVTKYRHGEPKNSTRRSDEQARITELEKQNRRLTMERDVLKKAMAFFAEIPK